MGPSSKAGDRERPTTNDRRLTTVLHSSRYWIASQNPIQTLSAPRPVERPRTNPLPTSARSEGYESRRGLSDHSGRQGRIMSMTPTVAHRNTNKSTPMRRSHSRANDGRPADTGIGATKGAGGSTGGLSSPTPVVWLAKGSLGSEIIARVVVS